MYDCYMIEYCCLLYILVQLLASLLNTFYMCLCTLCKCICAYTCTNALVTVCMCRNICTFLHCEYTYAPTVHIQFVNTSKSLYGTGIHAICTEHSDSVAPFFTDVY